MSIESDISSIKSDVKQLSRSNSDMKSDIHKMKSDVAKLKESDPGPFFTMVKGAALVGAISKIDGLSDKVVKLTRLADEKVKETRAARAAEEERLELAKEQDRRLQIEHETKMAYEKKQDQRLQLEHEQRLEAERKEKEQRNHITEIWVQYQNAIKEADLLKRYFAIREIFGNGINFDVSFVKDSTILGQYEELCTCHNSLLWTIKEKLGDQIFKALEDASAIQQELHRLASTPNNSSSYVAECKSLLTQIETVRGILPDLSFSTAEQQILSQQIEKWTHNSSLLASFMAELKTANVVTENVMQLFVQGLAFSYELEPKDLPYIFQTASIIPLETGDWTLFFDRAQKRLPEQFFDDVQIFFNFVAQKAEQAQINLCKEIFCNILKKNLPDVVIANGLPFEAESLSQSVMGYLPVSADQFVVFLDKSLFWIDCQKQFLETSTYTQFSEMFPCDAKQAIEAILTPLSKLGFVKSETLVLPEKWIAMESKYRTFWQGEKLAKERQAQSREIILKHCSLYAGLNMRPQLSLVNDSTGKLIAETAKKELIITEEGLTIKMFGFKAKSVTCTWEEFSKIRGELTISRIVKNVDFFGQTTALYADKRYYDLLQNIINELYPIDNSSANNIPHISTTAAGARGAGCFTIGAYVLSGIWLVLGLIITIGMLCSSDPEIKKTGAGGIIAVTTIIFGVPACLLSGICFAVSHRHGNK